MNSPNHPDRTAPAPPKLRIIRLSPTSYQLNNCLLLPVGFNGSREENHPNYVVSVGEHETSFITSGTGSPGGEGPVIVVIPNQAIRGAAMLLGE